MAGLALAVGLVRGMHVAAALSLLGTMGFLAWTLPAASAAPDGLLRRLRRLGWISGLIALLAGAAWFTLQSAAIADAGTVSELLDAIPTVAAHTRFGNVLLARLGLLLAATLAVVAGWRAGPYLGVVLTGVALGLQGLAGHAGAAGGVLGEALVVSECLHLLAAGIWLGALFPLWLSIRALAPVRAAEVCMRFSPIGMACVVILAGTGSAQGEALIGGLPALLGTAYGQFSVVKIVLFGVALALAGLNRLWLTDRVAAGEAGARVAMLVSLGIETGAGLAIVGAAAFMAGSPPAAHVPPVWPLSWQFSLVTVNEDADFRWEVTVSLLAMGAAVALLAGALQWGRFRLVAVAILALVVALRGPSLLLLTVEAYPTSFQVSPTGFSAASIARGQALFAPYCAACHGPGGAGDGPEAVRLRIRPADLTEPHIWEHTDGEMFWWLSHGIDDPEGGAPAMPGFGEVLPEDDRWALIDYVRAHNAGLALQQDAGFGVPLRAPAFPVTCSGGVASTMAGLRGYAVHVVTDGGAIDEVPPQSGITTVTLNLHDDGRPGSGSCAAADPAAWAAFSVLANVPPDDLAGTAFLIDPGGWLRAVHRPGSAGGWDRRENLIAAIRGICTSPIQPSNRGPHEHRH